MKSIRFNLPTLRPVRLLFAICVSALLLFSSAFPASAAAPAQPKAQGEANLTDLEQKAGEVARETPLSGEKTQAEANRGLNEIQGSASAESMDTPEKARNAPTAEGNVQEKLEKALNKLQGKG